MQNIIGTGNFKLFNTEYSIDVYKTFVEAFLNIISHILIWNI